MESDPLLEIITSADPAVRDISLDVVCRPASSEELIAHCEALDRFWRTSENLYERVRALFFLYAIHRFHLPQKMREGSGGHVPYEGFKHLLSRRFEEAIDTFLGAWRAGGRGDATSSALAAAYHQLGFQTLADQVRRSVRSVAGNRWMFRIGNDL